MKGPAMVWQRIKAWRGVAVALLTLWGGCAVDEPGTPVRARLLLSEGNSYGMKTVTFSTLNNAKTLDGNFFRFYGNAEIAVDLLDTDVVKAGASIYAQEPEAVSLDYKVSDGVIIPLNFDTHAMLVSFYYYERIVEFWRDQLGLSLSDYGKFRVIYEPDLRINFGTGIEVLGTGKLNAAFQPDSRDFWLFKTSRLERIPLKMNLFPLAHEFGHGIVFYRLDQKDLSFQQGASVEASMFFSGLNEGLADFFAFVVSGRGDAFTDSLPAISKERNLPVAFTSKDLLEGSQDVCSGAFYCTGSVLASSLYEVAGQSEGGPLKVAKLIFDKVLPAFRDVWLETKTKEDFTFHGFLATVIAQADAADKSAFCTSFIKWFDDKKNLAELKKTCASIR